MTSDEYKAERTARGTQATVAALLGVSRETVARRETGDQPIGKEAEMALLSLPRSEKPAPEPKVDDAAPIIQIRQRVSSIDIVEHVLNRKPVGELALARADRQPLLRPSEARKK